MERSAYEVRSEFLKFPIGKTKLPLVVVFVESVAIPVPVRYTSAPSDGSPVAVITVPEIIFESADGSSGDPVVACQGIPLLS